MTVGASYPPPGRDSATVPTASKTAVTIDGRLRCPAHPTRFLSEEGSQLICPAGRHKLARPATPG